MQEKPAKAAAIAPANFINAQSAIAGVRGRDLLSTLRNVAAQGWRH
ncbi:poly(3-hydroxyalkanoic acid) synthase 2, partial [Pseudomonas syringae pv. actinidiae ICMP 19079]